MSDPLPFLCFRQQARLLAAEYKSLGEKEKRKWEKKAEQEKLRYKEEMEHYVPMDDPSGGSRKKQKKDPNAPKRKCHVAQGLHCQARLSHLVVIGAGNMSAYFLYSVHIRPIVKEDNPDASFGDIARIISGRFKGLSSKEKKIWDDKAAADKEVSCLRGN